MRVRRDQLRLTMVSMIGKRIVPQKQQNLRDYCKKSFRTFLLETTLHGLKFLADRSITIWEKSFFLISFVCAFVIAVNLISNIYAKWISTPVIIGISPHPTSILQTPFPAITLCNMNQVLSSKVSNYSEESNENAMLKLLCFPDTNLQNNWFELPNFRNNNLKFSNFFYKYAQPCSRMLVWCSMGSKVENCSDLFHEVLTDEGLCCVFNMLHPQFLYKGSNNTFRNFIRTDGAEPIDWDPETGYPKNMTNLDKFYPTPSAGTGVSMGLSLIVNAELDEYYCSSTNGPGFKLALHNALEIPDIKETAITVPIGSETRFRIDVQSSEAVAAIRNLQKNERQCFFNNEESLMYFRHYSRLNCETECEAKYMHGRCHCVPFNLPLIYDNASVCSVKDALCTMAAQDDWLKRITTTCRDRCLPGCFDLNYRTDSFSTPLAEHNYITNNKVLRNLSQAFVKKNLAVLHFYYREYVFHGDLKNIYVGFTEFLSNTGGIMSLFMGFSFISLAEIIYFICVRPIFEFVLPNRRLHNNKQAIAINIKK